VAGPSWLRVQRAVVSCPTDARMLATPVSFQLICFLFFFPFVVYLHGRARPVTYIRASTSRVYLSVPHNAPSVNRTRHTPARPICSRPFAFALLPYHSEPWWIRGGRGGAPSRVFYGARAVEKFYGQGGVGVS